MKKKIKIAFHADMSVDIIKFIMAVLQKEFDVHRVRMGKDYDYYFAQEQIYSGHKNMLKFLRCKKNAIKIMICKEDIYPDLNLFDYAVILHKHHLQADDRILYLQSFDSLKTNEMKDLNEAFYYSFYKIFEQDKKVSFRRPEGTWPDVLYPRFMESVCGKKSRDFSISVFFDRMKGYIKTRIAHI